MEAAIRNRACPFCGQELSNDLFASLRSAGDLELTLKRCGANLSFDQRQLIIQSLLHTYGFPQVEIVPDAEDNVAVAAPVGPVAAPASPPMAERVAAGPSTGEIAAALGPSPLATAEGALAPNVPLPAPAPAGPGLAQAVTVGQVEGRGAGAPGARPPNPAEGLGKGSAEMDLHQKHETLANQLSDPGDTGVTMRTTPQGVRDVGTAGPGTAVRHIKDIPARPNPMQQVQQ